MLATLLAATLPSLDSCSACSTVGRVVKLCEPHAAEEKAVLAREARSLAAKDPAVRMEALDAVAALTKAHTNAPSARVVERIAASFDVEDFKVRARATSLLDRPQHALASLDALVAGLARAAKETASLDGEYEALSRKLEGGLGEKHRAELIAERDACDARRKSVAGWTRKLAERLAGFADDRSVEAILTHTERNLLNGLDEALMRLGTRGAVRELPESFAGCDRDLAAAEQEVAAWKAKATPGRLTPGMAVAMKTCDDMQALRTLALENLTKLLAERGLNAPGASASSKDWCAWIEQNLEAFPEHLPGIASPVW